MNKCTAKPEIYSRIVGYFRPVARWNEGKAQEYKDRTVYSMEKVLAYKTIQPSEGISETVSEGKG